MFVENYIIHPKYLETKDVYDSFAYDLALVFVPNRSYQKFKKFYHLA
jgi:hypothetical protein